MKKVLKFLKRTYKKVLRSIAFYPVLISISFFLLATVLLSVEQSKLVLSFKEEVPYLFIQDYETARSILSTIIGGILSLTVFSFSMVMVVLSQASSNFSHRLLPGLISNRRNQIILGIYIGTLLYCLIILISLGAYGVGSNSLGLTTMFAALFGMVCIGLFVYFIHGISTAIQIHNILDRIFKTCDSYLDGELSTKTNNKIPLNYIETSNWHEIKSAKSGYFRDFDIDLLHDSVKESSNQIEILPYVNQHIWKGMPILKVKEQVFDDDLVNLRFCLNISQDRHEDDKGIGGLIKLMEIAVKAMSPGINDPGTAIDAINKLGGLLAKFLQFPNFTSESLEGRNIILIKRNMPAEELMRILIQPIRLYSKHDGSVLYELIGALKYAQRGINISNDNREVVNVELDALRNDLEKNIENPIDKRRILNLFAPQMK